VLRSDSVVVDNDREVALIVSIRYTESLAEIACIVRVETLARYFEETVFDLEFFGMAKSIVAQSL